MSPLIWTTKKPTQAGWYFVKNPKKGKFSQDLYNIIIVEIFLNRMVKFVSSLNVNYLPLSEFEAEKWAGPILEPTEDIRMDCSNDYPPTFENVLDDVINIREKDT